MTDAAEMINFLAIWNRSNKMLIRKNMGKSRFSITYPKESIALFIGSAFPQPTSREVFLYKIEETLQRRTKKPIVCQLTLQAATTLGLSSAQCLGTDDSFSPAHTDTQPLRIAASWAFLSERKYRQSAILVPNTVYNTPMLRDNRSIHNTHLSIGEGQNRRAAVIEHSTCGASKAHPTSKSIAQSASSFPAFAIVQRKE